MRLMQQRRKSSDALPAGQFGAQLGTTTQALRVGSSSERGVYAASSQMKPAAMGFDNAGRITMVNQRGRRAPIVVVVPSCAPSSSAYLFFLLSAGTNSICLSIWSANLFTK